MHLTQRWQQQTLLKLLPKLSLKRLIFKPLHRTYIRHIKTILHRQYVIIIWVNTAKQYLIARFLFGDLLLDLLQELVLLCDHLVLAEDKCLVLERVKIGRELLFWGLVLDLRAIDRNEGFELLEEQVLYYGVTGIFGVQNHVSRIIIYCLMQYTVGNYSFIYLFNL